MMERGNGLRSMSVNPSEAESIGRMRHELAASYGQRETTPSRLCRQSIRVIKALRAALFVIAALGVIASPGWQSSQLGEEVSE